MEGQLIFQLTNDQYAVCRLIEAIPDNWYRMEGSLSAPEEMMNRVASGMSMFVRQPYPNPITITGIRKGSKAEDPDYEAFLHRGRPCQFVGFDVANGSGDLSFALVKKIAINYVRCRYTGNLQFFSKQCGDKKGDCPYICEFRLTNWLPEGEENMENAQLPAVMFKWKTQHGGIPTWFSRMAALCQELGFAEIKI